MRAALTPLLLVLAGLASPLVQAQTPAQAAPSGQDEQAAAKRPERRIENIRHEDAGSRIDEVREGGETKSITVQPKGKAPAYEVGPESGNRSPAAADRARGSGGWKILGF